MDNWEGKSCQIYSVGVIFLFGQGTLFHNLAETEIETIVVEVAGLIDWLTDSKSL